MTEEQQDELSLKFLGRILLYERSDIQNTHKKQVIAGIMVLHEVCSAATDVPTSHQHVWPVKVMNLPCNCQLALWIQPTIDASIHLGTSQGWLAWLML